MILLLGLKSLLLALVLPSIVSGGKEETNALLYLSKYGYIPKNANTEALVTEDNIKEYIKVSIYIIGNVCKSSTPPPSSLSPLSSSGSGPAQAEHLGNTAIRGELESSRMF